MSQYKVARPMHTHKASDVTDMLIDIYKLVPLKYPKVFQCNNGNEFISAVMRLL